MEINGLLSTGGLTHNEMQLLQTAIDSLGASVFAKDLNGRYTFVNRAFCDMVGAKLEEVVGHLLEDLFDPITATQLREDDLRVIATGQTVEQKEYRRTKVGGERHQYLTVKRPVYGRYGNIIGLSGVSLDVTSTAQVEVLLSESRQFLDLLLSNVDGHFYIKGQDRRYIFVSPKVAELLQRSPEQIIGHTDAELLPELEAQRVNAFDDMVFETGVRKAGEECLAGSRGGLRYFWSVKQLLRRGNQPDCLIGMSMDITELKLAQQAVASSETRFRTLFEGSRDGVLLLDQKKHFIDCNQAALELLGLTGKADCLGRTPVDFSPPVQACGTPSVDLAARYIDTINTEGKHRFDWLIKRPQDGATLTVEVSASMVDLDGETVILATVRDLTERMQYEVAIHQLAYYDALTDLPNRRLFFDHLSKALALSQRSGLFGAVIYLDLDNFKPVNDRYGHIAGDLLLKEVARRLAEHVRDQDTVARLGGDEFVVLLVNVAPTQDAAWQQAKRVAERIRDDLAKTYSLTFDTDEQIQTTVEHHCSASLGMTLFPPCGECGETILRRADNAMYQAKAAGRNQIYLDEGCGQTTSLTS
ncbi:diguanylate cyclase [Dechloromonas sp. XY25]|uniref:Diguanylate cyclase n=1 Tax=Dechloromonas hankyongensis TaxID=2908002 RepID=A0ABS9K4K4_9RHOO|nr:PAS domain-containing protein [Dechloromonas hankyongensis]MCG2578107.1 diguanylate cyclase [Dechloromonas hankyongensis]